MRSGVTPWSPLYGRRPRLVVVFALLLTASRAAWALHRHECRAGHDPACCLVCQQVVHAWLLIDAPACELPAAGVDPGRPRILHEGVVSPSRPASSVSPRAPPPCTVRPSSGTCGSLWGNAGLSGRGRGVQPVGRLTSPRTPGVAFPAPGRRVVVGAPGKAWWPVRWFKCALQLRSRPKSPFPPDGSVLGGDAVRSAVWPVVWCCRWWRPSCAAGSFIRECTCSAWPSVQCWPSARSGPG